MNLHIIKAEYGANDNFIDITYKLKKKFVKNNSLEILKGTNLNDAFTDPCFLNEKIIKIYIEVNNNTLIIYDYEYDNKLLNNILIDDEYLKKYDRFAIHNNNCKNEFRLLCLKYINYIRNINLPDFCINSNYESVLIEYRCLPHVEFLIRNTIIKLGEKWCHTVICGNLNYEFMVRICSLISSKIKVIKTNFDNVSASDYSKFLSSLEFWNLLNGEKILIYQEDSIIFKKNISDFLKWDYIGAPWPKEKNDNNSGVGNGGLSLRTKNIMVEIINKISIDETIINSSTIEYMKLTQSNVTAEDVYFSKNMEDLKIGLLANRESALNFSTESIVNNDSFGGHNFWLNDNTWKNRFIENNIIQFKPNYNLSLIEHRGGWKSVVQSLEKTEFYNNNSNYDFFDMIELNFMWNENKTFMCNNKWSGIIHCTPKTPDFLNVTNVCNLFDNEYFIKSLNNCVFLVTFSNYITDFLKKKFVEMNINIPLHTCKHPVDSTNIKQFNYNDFVKNNNKKILQIGQQLRKTSSIYLLDVNNYEKIWLTGTKHLSKCNKLLNKEIDYFNIDKNYFKGNVVMHYTNTFEEYDELLSSNIVFIDLFDASANNTIIECIIRNTPIIVNKLAPVVEYLGEDYPLYFNHLQEVPTLLTSKKIFAAHLYLSRMNKTELSIEYFTKQLMNISYGHFTK